MIKAPTPLICFIALTTLLPAQEQYVTPADKVSLKDAHKGSLKVDTRLLDSYGSPPAADRNFYLSAREIFTGGKDISFTDTQIVAAAEEHQMDLISSPMLGDLATDGVTLWFRPAKAVRHEVRIASGGGTPLTFPVEAPQAGADTRVRINGLNPDTAYTYSVFSEKENAIAAGSFRTAPTLDYQETVRIAFGADFHKIGLHNPNLFREILKRDPLAMLIYGDIASDGRQSNFSMHRSDYLLRDTSAPWSDFASQLPVYTSWDDWDYYANDVSAIDKRMAPGDRQKLRALWHANWVNPDSNPDKEGIYFKTRFGPVEYFALDTRSCRETGRRGQIGSYLGKKQHAWLKQGLRESTAPFKIISSGTMWTDHVSNGKDSWGPWDPQGREEIFNLIESEKIGGVLLISGDRHGTRGFKIPRPSGFTLYEFGVGSLGGVEGPKAMAPDASQQIFGYAAPTRAFGEFTFETNVRTPSVTFRLIDDKGTILEEHTLSVIDLTP